MKLCRLFVTRNLCLQGRVVDHAVSRRIFTREAGGQFQATPHNVSGLKSDTVTGFSLSNSVLPCHCHSTNTPSSSLVSTCCCYQNSRRTKRVITKQSNALSSIEREQDMKVTVRVYCFLCCRLLMRRISDNQYTVLFQPIASLTYSA